MIAVEVTIDGIRKMAAESSGEIRTFYSRGMARNFARNRQYEFDSWKIVDKETTKRRWITQSPLRRKKCNN